MQNNQKELIMLEDLGMQFATEKSKKKNRYAIYQCFCGNEFKTRVSCVQSENTKSCGCIKDNRHSIIHKLINHRIYVIWANIKQRCLNKNNKQYKNYGGRGITVCERWLKVENFVEDMYPTFVEGLTLDRKDNDKGYSKDNCRWVSRNIQARNTRILYSHNTSGYRGVTFNKTTNKWVSQIIVNNKRILLGCFVQKIDAAMAYDKYIINNNYEHTRNF